ncbi:MAG: choice-of-anchor J domain-containing protein [Alloprevotella sp.]|nr:choice-of-anchor J domain-containing protein [Alloprevotella sp.]
MKTLVTKNLALLALSLAFILPAAGQEAITPPWSTDFANAADFEAFTVIDANSDGKTWQYDDFAFAAFCSRDEKADDWLITSGVSLEAGMTYEMAITAAAYRSGVTESYTVYIGSAPTAAAMTRQLLAGTASSEDMAQETVTFNMETSGVYYIGIHYNTSDVAFAGSLSVGSLTLSGSVNSALPTAVTDFSLQAGEKGALTASLSFRAPTKDMGGNALSGLTKVEVSRDGSIVRTFNAPAPGAALSFEDTGLSNGLHRYSVVAANAEGESEAVTDSVFVGVDVPAAPQNFYATLADGRVTLTWDAPTIGKNGGYIDTDAISYTVRNAKNAVVATNLTACTFEDTPEITSAQAVIYYYLTAQTVAGTSDRVRSNMMATGEPTGLPFFESFPNGRRSTFWVSDYDKMARFWPLSVGSDAQDGDSGVLCFNAMEGNEWSRYFSGPITLQGTTNPTLTFYLFYIDPSNEVLNVEVSSNGGEFQTVQQISFADATGAGKYTKFSVPLKDYINADYVQIGFSSYTTTAYSLLYLDNLSIRNVVEHDLSVQQFTPARDLKVGEQRTFTVTVSNLGTAEVPAGAYTVELYGAVPDGTFRKLASSNGRAMASEASRNYLLNATADINLAEETEVYALINYADDGDQSNNRSASVRLTVHPNYYPVPTNLQAAGGAGTAVALSWDVPAAPRTTDGSVTEDFEAAPDFSISDFADWTLYDGDKGNTYGITMGGEFVYFPNNGSEMAYIVMNAGTLGLPSQWHAHSGSKALASMSTASENDNWLISPQLSGTEQTISFYAKSVTAEYPERYQVMYSTLDVSPTSFRALDDAVILPAEWTLCEHELPEGTKYFAIRSIRENGFALLLDDVTFCPDSLAARDLMLVGYNVYRNGEKLNSAPLSEPSYTDGSAPEDAIYRVTAVYEEGESAYSNEAVIGFVGIQLPTGSTGATATGTTFDLQGRRVVQPGKGIYIQGGRKVLR